jgi:hypothetical protein
MSCTFTKTPVFTAVVTACYTDPSPNGRLYSHVIDLVGDANYEHPAAAQIAHTLAPSVIIARCSAAQLIRFPGSIKAHVRSIPPFYEHTDPKRRYSEDDQKGWQFNVGKDAVRALWWHETIRAVGNVEGLPLVMLKLGIPYGRGMVSFERTFPLRPFPCALVPPLPPQQRTVAPFSSLMTLGSDINYLIGPGV